jgi:hypothetical protein
VPRSIAANPASPQIAKRSLSCIFLGQSLAYRLSCWPRSLGK